MRSGSPPRRRRSSASFWLGGLLILLLVVGGGLATAALLGLDLNPFDGHREDPFMVRIPINSRPIPAYEPVDRTHLLHPATGQLAYQPIPPAAVVGMSLVGVATDGSHVEGRIEAVRNVNDQVVFVVAGGQEVTQGQTLELGGAIMNVNAILGRVVKRDKRPGLGFREENFFPQGTPAGIAGATPPGMRAVTLDATRLTGVHALQAGDRIDLLASVPVGEVGSFQSRFPSRLPGAALVKSSDATPPRNSTEPVLLAQSAVVLKPVYVRNEATASSSLTQGTRVQNVPKYEVAIAVAPDDVLPLQAALNQSLEITCVAHSMQSGEVAETPSREANSSEELLVPVTVRPILAYDVVIRESFVHPGTRRVRLERMPRSEVQRLGVIASLEEALGAVARHDIPAGACVRRSDLLAGSADQPSQPPPVGDRQARSAVGGPIQQVSFQEPSDSPATRPSVVGDRPAISSFIPAGYTALAIPWNRLYGAEYLQIGDRIDLLVSYSLESENEEEETETRADGTRILRKRHDLATRETLRTWDESLGGRGEPWFVATGAIVVGPVGFPPPNAALRALGANLERQGEGASDRTQLSGPPLVIAVEDRDVESLAAALVTKRALFTPAIHRMGGDDPVPPGSRRIAIAAQNVEAFERLSDTMWQGNRRRPLTRLVADDDPLHAETLDASQLAAYEGRVLGQAKRRGEPFTAEDFLPVGTEPGLAAAAQRGSTVFAASDREIEGLDSFLAGDRIAILVRGVTKPLENVTAIGLQLEHPVATVVVPQARVVRGSRGGQTMLEVDNRDLARLQAILARSLTDSDATGERGGRTHLLAVGLPRDPQPSASLAGNRETPRANGGPWPDEPVGLALEASHAGSIQADGNQADGVPASDIRAYDPLEGTKVMEAVVGGRRQYFAFPAGTGVEADGSDIREVPR